MNPRFVPFGRAAKGGGLASVAACLAFSACAVAPSRAPLGGNYAVEEHDSARDRSAPDSGRALEPATNPEPVATAARESAVATAPAPTEDAGSTPLTNAHALHYEPLKVGDKVAIEASMSIELALDASRKGVVPGDGKFALDAKFRFDLTVSKLSGQALDELEVTITPLLMRSRFADKTSDEPLPPPEKYQVSLGSSPSVRPSSNSASDNEGSSALLFLCTQLAAFQEHWARSPTLELKRGWSSRTPITVPPSKGAHSGTLNMGPFNARYTGAEASAAGVPFDISLPVQYAAAIGRVQFDLSGTAHLSAAQARPVSIELSGPANGSGGPADGSGALSAHGTSKFSALLSYP